MPLLMNYFSVYVCFLPAHPPETEGHQIRKRHTPEKTILNCRRVSTDRPNREGSQLAASLEGEPGPTPAGKTLPHSCPETRFRRARARDLHCLLSSPALSIPFSPVNYLRLPACGSLRPSIPFMMANNTDYSTRHVCHY